MTSTPGSAVFLDTNILIYSSFPASPFHAVARLRLLELEARGTRFWASRQVLREFLAATTRPGVLTPAPDVKALAYSIRQFEARFEIADEGAAVTAALLSLMESQTIQGKQVHDANVAATMIANGVSWLLTHNTPDFVRFAPAIRVLPLIP